MAVQQSHLVEQFLAGGQRVRPSVKALVVFGLDESISLIWGSIRKDLLGSRHVVAPHVIGHLVPVQHKELRRQDRGVLNL